MTEFKARCLELMQAVHDRRLPQIMVLKHGKPLAKIVAADESPTPHILGCMEGSLTIVGDVTTPLDVEWEALRD